MLSRVFALLLLVIVAHSISVPPVRKLNRRIGHFVLKPTCYSYGVRQICAGKQGTEKRDCTAYLRSLCGSDPKLRFNKGAIECHKNAYPFLPQHMSKEMKNEIILELCYGGSADVGQCYKNARGIKEYALSDKNIVTLCCSFKHTDETDIGLCITEAGHLVKDMETFEKKKEFLMKICDGGNGETVKCYKSAPNTLNLEEKLELCGGSSSDAPVKCYEKASYCVHVNCVSRPGVNPDPCEVEREKRSYCIRNKAIRISICKQVKSGAPLECYHKASKCTCKNYRCTEEEQEEMKYCIRNNALKVKICKNSQEDIPPSLECYKMASKCRTLCNNLNNERCKREREEIKYCINNQNRREKVCLESPHPIQALQCLKTASTCNVACHNAEQCKKAREAAKYCIANAKLRDSICLNADIPIPDELECHRKSSYCRAGCYDSSAECKAKKAQTLYCVDDKDIKMLICRSKKSRTTLECWKKASFCNAGCYDSSQTCKKLRAATKYCVNNPFLRYQICEDAEEDIPASLECYKRASQCNVGMCYRGTPECDARQLEVKSCIRNREKRFKFCNGVVHIGALDCYHAKVDGNQPDKVKLCRGAVSDAPVKKCFNTELAKRVQDIKHRTLLCIGASDTSLVSCYLEQMAIEGTIEDDALEKCVADELINMPDE